ncbi:hypothetical protein BX070DRAFT_237757 [Coemansia spiralis]|nr:hypothetical protein BX070DRAFT_237757 [Coemansia spiralis]
MKYSFVFGKLGKDQPAATDPPASHGTVKSNPSEAAEIQADFVSTSRFADNFWSADERCISVLMHKLKSAKQTCADILQMVTARAQMEEDLGKKLGKLARGSLGSEEVGTVKSALRTIRMELETNAKSHMDLARQLRAEIEKPLAAFISDQRAKRRAQTTVIQKTEGDRNALRSQVRKLQDKRRADTKRVGDLDLQVNGLQGVGDPKLKSKLDRAQMQQRATETEYVDVRQRLKEADQQWFNVWRSACDVFQVLEEERLEYLKTCLWTYTNLVSSCCVADDESMERIRQDLEKISVADDIAAFIQTFGTGAPDPELASLDGETPVTAEQPSSSRRSADNSDESKSANRQSASFSSPSTAVPSAIPAPDLQLYANRSATPVSTHGTMVGTNGSARSGSILAHSVNSRPQTQESMRPQQQRPASMHNAGQPSSMQAQQIFSGNGAQWNNRPASSMQGPIDANNYRRASNNDMYAVANGQQQQQQQQFVQRTNSQMASRPIDGYTGYVDPRAPMYRGTESPVPLQGPAPIPQGQRPGTPSQMADPYANVPHMGSRASTYSGAAHTGNFGTLTANTMLPQQQQQQQQQQFGVMAQQQQQQTNSAPSSPYQQTNRPMSATGMHPMTSGSPQMGRPATQSGQYAGMPIYRSATPVQQSPQFIAMGSRPPTQMSHSPVPQMMGQQMQRAPSVMAGYPAPVQQQQQQQQQGPRVAEQTNVSESGKEILFYVKVLYDYDAENERELTIREGDVISVLAVSADGWWEGELTDRRTGRAVQGTFPSNFTDPIANFISN